MNYHRDGFIGVDANRDGRVNYQPNSLNGPAQREAFDEPPLCSQARRIVFQVLR